MAEDMIKETGVWPVNNEGEILVQAGTGSTTVAGYLPEAFIPTDVTTGKMVIRFPDNIGGGVQFQTDIAGATKGLAGTQVGGKKFPFDRPIRNIGFIGDSITQLCDIFGMQFTKTTTIAGVCVSDVPIGNVNTPTGAGTLYYNATNKTLAWQAPTDTVGTPVVVTDGIYNLPSGNPTITLKVTVTARSLPNTDATATYTSSTAIWIRRDGGFPYIVDSMTGGRFNFMTFGIGGNRSTDMPARYDQVINAGVDVIVDESGTNDLVAANMTPAACAAARAANWDKALAKGIPVIVVLIPPRWGLTKAGAATSDSAAYSAAFQASIVAANNLIIKEAKARRGVYVADCYSKATLATDTKGSVKNGFTTDGLHPAGGLGYEMAEPVARILNVLVPDDRVGMNVGAGAYYDATNNVTGNLLNTGTGTFVGTTGTAGTGVTAGTGIATNWTAQRSVGSALVATANKVAATDGGADWQEFVVSGAADANYEQLFFYPTAPSASRFSPGDALQMQVEWELVGAGCSGIIMDCLLTGGTPASIEAGQMANVVQGIRHNGVLRTEPVVMGPTSITAVQPRLFVRSQAGATFTIRFRNMSLNKVV